jgi:hypothetical protein
VKLSPALPDDTLATLGGHVEFLSERGECKEACVWFGDARGAAGNLPRAAVLLPERLVVTSRAGRRRARSRWCARRVHP